MLCFHARKYIKTYVRLYFLHLVPTFTPQWIMVYCRPPLTAFFTAMKGGLAYQLLYCDHCLSPLVPPPPSQDLTSPPATAPPPLPVILKPHVETVPLALTACGALPSSSASPEPTPTPTPTSMASVWAGPLRARVSEHIKKACISNTILQRNFG